MCRLLPSTSRLILLRPCCTGSSAGMANPDSQRGGDAMTDEEGDQHRATQVQSQPTVDTASIEAQLVGLRYVDKARVARDVLGLIRNSNSLLIKIQPFVHANGTSETLLCLTGTTPIYYKNACYNIPVSLWLGDQYPHRPPSCFVTPTRDMRIKDGHLHVDHFGTIYLPYLNQWSAATSNLLEMVTIMSSVFSQDPPVFKVPANAAPQQPPQPSPVVQQPQQQPQPQQMQPSSHHPQQQQPVQQQAPFLSPAHLQQSPQQPQYNNPYVIGAASPPIPPRTVSPASAASNSGVQQQQQSPYSVNGVSPSPAPPVPIDPRAQKKSQLVAQLTLKLRQQLTDDLSLKTLLMDDLVQSQQAVDAHAATIDESLASLSAELAQVQHAAQSLQSQNDELTRWLEQHEKREIPEVDRMCYVKDTWSKQLLDAVSLDHALDDAYYLLDRALQDERVDVASYTKQIRALSRKQFYARCLIKQIQQQQQQQQQAQSGNAVAAAQPQQPQPQHMQAAQHYAAYEHAAGAGGAGQLPQQNPQAKVYGGGQQQQQYPGAPHHYAPQLQMGPPVVGQQWG